MLETIQKWHRVVEQQDLAALNEIIADDAVFYSPVVHTPQVGKAITVAYLSAAAHVLNNPTFKYTREIYGERDAMLEFEVEIDGILMNAVDIIKFDDQDKIIEFKVMFRPLKAVQLIHQKMGEMLSAMKK